jgi:hypothetical protein
MRTAFIASCIIIAASLWGAGMVSAADEASVAFAKEVTAEFDNVTLADALARLADAADAKIKFGANAGGSAMTKIRRGRATLPLEKHLDEILEPLQLGCRVRGGTIFIVRQWKDARVRLSSVTSVELVSVPMQEAVDFLSDRHGVNFILPKEVAGDIPITFKADNIPLSDVLTKLLRPIGLTYEVQGDRFLIVAFHQGPWTPEDALQEKIQTRLQAVRLDKVAKLLADRVHAEIVFDPDAGEAKSRSVTHIADGVSLKQALTEILAPLGAQIVVRRDEIHVTRIKKNPQDALRSPVSVLFLDTRLDEALRTLSTLYQVEIVAKDPVNDAEPIRYRADGKPLADALSEMLRLIGATYEIQDGYIVVVAAQREAKQRLEN